MNTPIRIRPGQALIELALGLFVVTLLSSAIFYFVQFMTKSLKIQNQLRSPSPVYGTRVPLDDFAATKIFGVKKLHINEPHGATSREIPNTGGFGR